VTCALFIAARRGAEEGDMEAAPRIGGSGGARRGGWMAAVGRSAMARGRCERAACSVRDRRRKQGKAGG
jgi:hypothetical protein